MVSLVSLQRNHAPDCDVSGLIWTDQDTPRGSDLWFRYALAHPLRMGSDEAVEVGGRCAPDRGLDHRGVSDLEWLTMNVTVPGLGVITLKTTAEVWAFCQWWKLHTAKAA